MNTVSIIGTGYVGLVTGTCLSEFGMQVTCMDVNKMKVERLKRGELPIYEPGLDELVTKNYNVGRLKFTTQMEEAAHESTVIFIAVGTPPMEDGSADLKYVVQAAKSIAEHMNEYRVIVNKSTVPVGTGEMVKQTIKSVLKKRGVNIEFDVVSNPEFLREGAAVRDFMHPDRIVIGCESERARDIMKGIYNVLYLIDTPFLFTNIVTAELIKYASNAFLATKISFINEVANLCEEVGADVHHIAKGMGLDGRISKYFLHPGPGFGGSCFPKDTKALARIGKEHGTIMSVVESVISANENQKARMVLKIEKKFGGLEGKILGILGLAFKPGTDDIRESPSIMIIDELISKGARVKVYDPIAMENAKQYAFAHIEKTGTDFIGNESVDYKIQYCKDEYEAVEGTDGMVIITEWNQFRHLDLMKIKNLMKGNCFFDFRNIYEREDVTKWGFAYEGVGR